MGPEISTNIGSVLRAMEAVIMPALHADQGLAQEQAYLITVYLKMIQEQHDKIFHFRQQEVREYSRLIIGLLAQQPEINDHESGRAARQLLKLAAPVIDLQIPAYSWLADLVRDLREAADEIVVDMLEMPETNQQSMALMLLAQAQDEALRERAWVDKLGVDPQPLGEFSLDELSECRS